MGATSGTTTSTVNYWSDPVQVSTHEYPDRIEMIYKRTSLATYTIDISPAASAEEEVFKIIFSCKNGKWHKSDPIYGTIISHQEESYEF